MYCEYNYKWGNQMKKLLVTLSVLTLLTSAVHADPEVSPPAIASEVSNVSKLLKMGKKEDAVALLETVLTQDPYNLRALRLRGNIHFANSEFEQALEDFNTIVHLRPRSARPYFDRGIIYFAMENDEMAMDDIERAFAMNPQLVDHIDSRPTIASKIHEAREKAHAAKYQVRCKRGMINTKKGGGLITKHK